jgi:hypothetical protein
MLTEIVSVTNTGLEINPKYVKTDAVLHVDAADIARAVRARRAAADIVRTGLRQASLSRVGLITGIFDTALAERTDMR